MKKKMIGMFSAMVIAAIAFFATTTSAGENGIDLTSLVKINAASAECCRSPINNGRCSFTYTCYANPGGCVDCDTYCP